MVSLQSSVLCIHVLGTSSFVKADGMFSLLYYFPFYMSAKFVSGNSQCIRMCNIHTILLYHRVVTKISSCRVNTTGRRGIKQLGISFGSIFLLFSNKSSRGPLS